MTADTGQLNTEERRVITAAILEAPTKPKVVLEIGTWLGGGSTLHFLKALQANGTIAGYTVKEISLNSVKLAAGDATVDLPVGKQMVYDDSDGWSLGGDSVDYEGQGDNGGTGMMEGRGRFNDQGAGSAGARTSSYVGAASTAGVATPATPAVPSGPMSDVLKKLMQQRQQESK